MAVTLTPTNLQGPYGDYNAGDADVAMVNITVGEDHVFVLRPDDIVLVYNPDASAHAITIESSETPVFGRVEDITNYSIGAGEFAAFGPFVKTGWANTSGQLVITGDSAQLEVGVLRQT